MESNWCDYDNGASKRSEKHEKQSKKQRQKLSIDPQSIAARNRREKIRRRLKILQSMVPGGEKMDTASMLDEAIQYVKFLQLMHIWLQARIIEGHSSTTNSPFNASFLYAHEPCNSNGFSVHTHALNAIPLGYNSMGTFTDQGSAISQYNWNHCGDVHPYHPEGCEKM